MRVGRTKCEFIFVFYTLPLFCFLIFLFFGSPEKLNDLEFSFSFFFCWRFCYLIFSFSSFCTLKIRVPFNSRLTRRNLILFIFSLLFKFTDVAVLLAMDVVVFFCVMSRCRKEKWQEIVNSFRRLWDGNERWKDRQQTEDSIELVRCVYVIRHTNAYWRNWCAQTCELCFPTWIIINRTLLSSAVYLTMENLLIRYTTVLCVLWYFVCTLTRLFP